MAARLTSTSVVFGDNSTLSSFYGIIPRGTVTTFYQSYTPSGWTAVTTQNDKAFRVVSGDGGGQGGNRAFSDLFSPQGATNFTTLSGSMGSSSIAISQLPSHSHGTPDGTTLSGGFNIGAGRGYQVTTFGVSSGPGSFGGLSHAHPFSNASIAYTYNLNFNVNYVDVILARFN
jgi:hypothetical protein